MNIIKTQLRNGLYDDTLNDLMLISILRSSNLEEFDPHPAITQWKTMAIADDFSALVFSGFP